MSKRKARMPLGQPSKKAFVDYARSTGINPELAGDQWEIWDVGGWCDGQGNAILNWKLKLATFWRQKFGVFNPRTGRRDKAQRDKVAEANARAEEVERARREYDEQKRQQKRD